MVHTIERKPMGKHTVSVHKVSVHRSSDIGDAFWGIESGRTIKHGHTPSGVRDEIVNENGLINYYLWGNNIATFHDGILTIRDTGWKTMLTKDRLNNVLSTKFNYNVGIQQEKMVWYLNVNNKRYKWSDGDNKLDVSSPAKYLEPVEESKMKEKVKELTKTSRDFVKEWKEGIFNKTLSQEKLDKLYGIFSERGRHPEFAQLFLQDNAGNWNFEKMQEHWNMLRMDLLWYVKRKIQRGEA